MIDQKCLSTKKVLLKQSNIPQNSKSIDQIPLELQLLKVSPLSEYYKSRKRGH